MPCAQKRVHRWSAASLEEQALGPITSPDEMAQDLDELVEELGAIPSYVEEFERSFGSTVNEEDIARALAAYQRSLITLRLSTAIWRATRTRCRQPPKRV
jgi:cytochrome c peroxidase